MFERAHSAAGAEQADCFSQTVRCAAVFKALPPCPPSSPLAAKAGETEGDGQEQEGKKHLLHGLVHSVDRVRDLQLLLTEEFNCALCREYK